jgi:hypothetical protein
MLIVIKMRIFTLNHFEHELRTRNAFAQYGEQHRHLEKVLKFILVKKVEFYLLQFVRYKLEKANDLEKSPIIPRGTIETLVRFLSY